MFVLVFNKLQVKFSLSQRIPKIRKYAMNETISLKKPPVHREDRISWRLHVLYLNGHRISTTSAVIISKKQYRYAPEARKQSEIQTEKQLKSGLMAQSKSAYSSLVMIIPKKPDACEEKKFRVVINYRVSNAELIEDAYTLLNITDILEQLG